MTARTFAGSDWLVAKVVVTDAREETWTFVANAWLRVEPDEDAPLPMLDLTAGAREYVVEVHTGDVRCQSVGYTYRYICVYVCVCVCVCVCR